MATKPVVRQTLARRDAVWLNRHWAIRRPSAHVLARIAEELGETLALFDGDPRTVIAVVEMLTRGRSFLTNEHLRIARADVPDIVRQAKAEGFQEKD